MSKLSVIIHRTVADMYKMDKLQEEIKSIRKKQKNTNDQYSKGISICSPNR